jgi:hypothetical protein
VPAKRLAFEREPIAVGDDLKNQINNRGPGRFIVRSKVLVAKLNRPL